ncbi:hypothetical protein EX30DRAFT_373713 [Ascodesmis nigricans]|uniref:Uncharacterized protein n=1 Tax=Ascodesmis nigricans TaxID=341454 RepID=A0A4S2MN09_9PEZI|nr:hypothetical protein EX30DRAFT_373713 [Ascodesmis nigricans]
MAAWVNIVGLYMLAVDILALFLLSHLFSLFCFWPLRLLTSFSAPPPTPLFLPNFWSHSGPLPLPQSSRPRFWPLPLLPHAASPATHIPTPTSAHKRKALESSPVRTPTNLDSGIIELRPKRRLGQQLIKWEFYVIY